MVQQGPKGFRKFSFFIPLSNELQLVPFNVLALQGGAKRLPNYHLVGEICVFVGENLFDLPDLVGENKENICLLKICLLGGSSEREGLTNHDCNQVIFKAFTMTNFLKFSPTMMDL